MNWTDVQLAISTGSFDSQLLELKTAIDARLTSLRRSRTIDDYRIGDAVVFNDYCGTAYLRGHRATVVARGRTKISVELDTPVGRFVRVEDGISKSVTVKVPPSIVDLVA